MRDQHHNADSLGKKTEFYERLEQKQAIQAEIKERFSFLNKKTYEALPLTRSMDKSGYPNPGHPELLVEEAAEIKILSKKDPMSLNLLLRSNPLLRSKVMRMLGGLMKRELTTDEPE